MSTKTTIKSSVAKGEELRFHFYEDLLDEFDARDGATEPPLPAGEWSGSPTRDAKKRRGPGHVCNTQGTGARVGSASLWRWPRILRTN